MKNSNAVIRFRPRKAALVNPSTAPELYHVQGSGGTRSAAPPGVGGSGGVVPFPYAFKPDGFIFPRPEDQRFDVTVRQSDIAVSATVEVTIWQVEDRIKGGWIRGLGYGFNNPHGDFTVRTFLLINDAVPSDYLFRTVDSALGTFQGSFPPLVLGSVQNPTDVYIRIPAQSKVSIRFVNGSSSEAFAGAVRLKGWLFTE